MVKKIIPLAVIILLSLFSVRYLFLPGFPPTHDGEYHVIRFFEFYKTLQGGVIYPRWAMDLNYGFGVPLFNYVYPLPNYIASVFYFFGVSFVNSFKFSMIVATVMGGLLFYFWMKNFVADKFAVAASIVYVFSPYHFLDVIIRGSIGEVWALAFFPGFLWTVTVAITNEKNKYLALSIIFLSLTVFSHNILGLMFFGFAMVYTTFLGVLQKKLIFYKLVKIAVLTIGMTSIFWLPALWEKRYVTGLEVFNPTEHFPEIFQLIFPSWGSGFASGGFNNQMSFQIGVINLLFVLTAAVLCFFIKKQRLLIIFFLFLFLIVFFLMIRQSSFFWNHVPLFEYFQFPWRFLSLLIIITSFLSGTVLSILKKNIFVVLTVIFCVILTYSYAKPAYLHQRNDIYYTSRSNFIDGTNSPGNAFNIEGLAMPNDRAKSLLQRSVVLEKVLVLENNPQKKIIEVSLLRDTILTANIAYFPGWNVYVDGGKSNLVKNRNGLINFEVKKGKHSVALMFENTTVRLIGFAISIMSILICLAMLINYKYAKKAYENCI